MNEPPNSPPPGSDPESAPEEATVQQPTPPPALPPTLPPPAPAEAGPAPGITFGGFWIRFAAYIIDGLVLFAIDMLLAVLFILATGVSTSPTSPFQGPFSLVTFVIPVGYFVWFWVRGGSTPGMSLLGLQVVRDADGGPITWGKALLRYVGLVISSIVLFIGLIWVAFDSRKRGWHDLIAGTVVIRRPDVEVSGGRKVLMIGAIGCGCLLPILAIAGIVSLIFLGPIVDDIFGRVADDLARASDGEIVEPVEIGFESLRVGDCFNIVNPEDPASVALQAVPCADEHVFEVFFAEDMPAGPYPGEEAVTAFVNDGCIPAFEEYVGLPFAESLWDASPAVPAEADWEAGILRVTCQLHNLEGTPVTGSARGSGE